MAHRLLVLALPGVVTFDLSCAIQVFRPAPGSGAPEALYDCVIASPGGKQIVTSDGLSLQPVASLTALDSAQTIVVPGYHDASSRPPSAAALRALEKAAGRGARIVSFCVGAFALGHAGLLDDRRATTHWEAAPALARQFPRARVDRAPLYIEDRDVLTSAGMAAALDLALHVVRVDHGASIASDVARWNVLSPHREGGQAQFIPRPITAPGQAGLSATRNWALEHLDRPLRLADLAAHACCSERTLSRRFLAETGDSPKQWLLRMRLSKARELLEESSLSIEQIAERAGFPTANALRAQFDAVLSTTPTAYRHRFRGNPT